MKKVKKRKQYRYTTLENMSYAFSGAAKWRPVILACTLILALTEGLKDFVWIYGGKRVIDVLESGDQTVHNFQNILWIVLIAALTEGMLLMGKEISQTTAASRITDVRCKFILMTNRKVMKMPYELLEDPKVEDLKRRCDEATGNMTEGMEAILRESPHFFAQFIMMLAAAGILLYLNPIVVLIMFVLAMGRGLLHNHMAKYEKEEFHNKMIPTWRKNYYYFRTTTNFECAKDVRIFNMKNAIGEKQQVLWDDMQCNVEKLHNKWRHTLLSEEVIGLAQEGVMYGWLIYGVLRQNMSIADFTLYVGSIRSFNSAVNQLLEKWNNMVRDSRELCDFRDFLEYPDSRDEKLAKSNFRKDYQTFMGANKKKYKEIVIPKDGKYGFRFENVSFKYSGSENYALRNLNISLEPGKRLAVVGLNGAGKSTFIKLLCRLYEPTEGHIYMNNQDIAEFDREEYFKLIAPVFQNVECFAFPLAENVSMSVPEKTDRKRAEECLSNAGLKEKVENLEQGIDTELLKFLQPKGVELSGGEKQKMSLARALYKNSPIVVLDEPTAALDALAEYKTYRDFDKLIGGKTAVYISHRLSSTRFCHQVAMFESGCLIEYGTHEELLKAGKAYAKMFEVQAQYYKEGGGGCQ